MAVTTVEPSFRSKLVGASRRVLGFAFLASGVAVAAGCPAAHFPDEGPGQPPEWASGNAPDGVVGACRVPLTKRPPLVNPELWEHLRRCDSKTPRRYLRVGYGASEGDDAASDRRMASLLDSVKDASAEKDGNLKMLGLVRSLKKELAADPAYRSRINRQSGRTFACDYRYLFETTEKQRESVEDATCPVFAYDPKEHRQTCLFDTNLKEARWLASAWSCLAFTDTVGEGGSCHRLCAYDDFCSAQVGCAQPDFDLALCALGVCLPETVSGIL